MDSAPDPNRIQGMLEEHGIQATPEQEDSDELIDVPPGAVECAKLPPLPPGTESVAVDVIIWVRGRGA